jgi:hypothetical protein
MISKSLSNCVIGNSLLNIGEYAKLPLIVERTYDL